ncbi:hypothetical protein PQX77_009158, partial [Marasmius sp. AFHP31]
MGTVAFSDKSRPTSPELFKVGDELLSGWALASLSFNGWKDMARQPRRTEDDGGRCEEEIRDRCGDNSGVWDTLSNCSTRPNNPQLHVYHRTYPNRYWTFVDAGCRDRSNTNHRPSSRWK